MKWLVGAAAAIGLLSGTLVLLGWMTTNPVLKSGVPGLVAMNPLTAICFLLAGLSLWLLRDAPQTNARLLSARLLAGGVILAGISQLAVYAFGWEFGLDRVLFRDNLHDNRMAPNTAVCFVLAGLALATLHTRLERLYWLSQASALAVAGCSLLSLIGYGYGADALYGVSGYIPMAFNTATVFQILSIAAVTARTDRGLAALLSSRYSGGYMARRLLPAAIAIPCTLGWVRIMGQRAGLYDTEFGAALMVSLTVLILVGIVMWTGNALNRAEQAIRRLNDELEQRVAERTWQLAAANEDLTQKSQENEMFVYSVSHDLRSPLVNLQGFSRELASVSGDLRDLVADERVPVEIRERSAELIDGDMQQSIHFIQSAVSRLSSIIDALLRLSRAGRVNYLYATVDVQAAVIRIAESLSATIAKRDAALEVRDLPPVEGDPGALEQVFANLIDNAVKYLAPNRPGLIEIGCQEGPSAGDASGRHITYYVKDNGLGFPESCREKIFLAFRRAHPDAAAGEGMGLAIARRVVERHSGRLWVESQEGAGTTFFVSLPIRRTAPAAEPYPVAKGA